MGFEPASGRGRGPLGRGADVDRCRAHEITSGPGRRSRSGVSAERARLGIGYLPQEPSIFRGLSVEQNIRAVLEVVEQDRDKREIMLDDLLAEFSITHLRRAPALAAGVTT